MQVSHLVSSAPHPSHSHERIVCAYTVTKNVLKKLLSLNFDEILKFSNVKSMITGMHAFGASLIMHLSAYNINVEKIIIG